MDVRAQVGLNVRRFRKAAGLSQEELADRARLDRTYVSGVERGIRNPTVLVLQDLAGVLGVRAMDLLDFADSVVSS
jgi:transcriptional regulator with XRE-family HTH domain